MERINIAEKQERYETLLIRVGNYKLISTFVFDPMAEFDQRQKGSVRITVEPYETNVPPYMFIYQYTSSLPSDLQNMKEFDSLKAMHKYIRDTKNVLTFKQVEEGKGELRIKASKIIDKGKNQYEEPSLVRLTDQIVFACQTQDMRKKRIEALKERKEKLDKIAQQFKKIDEASDYDKYTVVFQSFRPIPQYTEEQKNQITKAVIRFGYVDLNIPEFRILSDRQLFKIGKKYVYEEIKKFKNIEKVNIQWNKMCVRRQISKVIKQLSALKNLKSLNFDGQSNQFTQQFFQDLNLYKDAYQNLEELHIFFNIGEENNYFDESWWHPEHRDQYKGRLPIDVNHWIAFTQNHKKLRSIWIGRDNQTNKVEAKTDGMKLYTLKDGGVERKWESLAIGMYEDLKLDTKFWNQLKTNQNQDRLKSICFARLLNIDGDAIRKMLERNKGTLENFMLCWCDGSIKQSNLEPLKDCLNLKYLNLRSSPFKPNDEVNCSFLTHKTLQNLEFLSLDGYQKAADNFTSYIKEIGNTDKLKYVGLPRNDWVTVDIIRLIAQVPKLRSLNLYNNRFASKQEGSKKEMVKLIKSIKQLRVLNIGTCFFDFDDVFQIVSQLKQLKKLNISDISSVKHLRSDIYKNNWAEFQYPKEANGEKKDFKDLSQKQINQFLCRINNKVFNQITPCLQRLTHLDIRNVCVDEKPFGKLDVMPNLRYINCEFDLYKKIDAQGRKQITFF